MKDKDSISTVALKDNLAETLNRAAYGKERILIKRRGKALAALVPIEDFDDLEAQEDERDAKEADAFMKTFRAGGSKGKSIDEIIEKYRAESKPSGRK